MTGRVFDFLDSEEGTGLPSRHEKESPWPRVRERAAFTTFMFVLFLIDKVQGHRGGAVSNFFFSGSVPFCCSFIFGVFMARAA